MSEKKHDRSPDVELQHPPKKTKAEKKNKDRFAGVTFKTRHVALKLSYIGENYHGFAAQDGASNTVEDELFRALLDTNLIQSKDDCQYTRCGRTDAGVNALGQVVALQLRTMEGVKADGRELPYPSMLNARLPDDIRIVAWAPVPTQFNARFSALHRTYKYYFQRENMDIEKMREACKLFIGEHDFRNFCKMDAANVDNFVRVVLSFSIDPVPGLQSPDPYFQMYEMTICGFAFLWHQVRCMAEVLFMVGRGQEQPSIVSRLLDLTDFDRKPQYGMASERALCLYECGFEDLKWETDVGQLERVASHYEEQLQYHLIHAAMLMAMRDRCNDMYLRTTAVEEYRRTLSTQRKGGLSPDDIVRFKLPAVADAAAAPAEGPADAAAGAVTAQRGEWVRYGNLIVGSRTPRHIPLEDRPRQATLTERVGSLSGKRKQVYDEKQKLKQAARGGIGSHRAEAAAADEDERAAMEECE